ncbi:hypothetical protein ACHAXT_004301 [Thalassiosira profunda]
MLIRRLISRPRPPAAQRWMTRSQGTAAAVAYAANERIANADDAARKHYRKPAHFNATVYATAPVADFSSVALNLKRDDGDYYWEDHSEALFKALDSYIDDAQDVILILMRHGEAQHNAFERDFARAHGTSREAANADAEYPVDPMLTGKGCGQMLDVSRRTATFFNSDTGLQPDLFVVSPLRRAIQSALIAFPTHTALGLSGTPWVCHPHCMEMANGNKSEFVSPSEELREMFPGVDFSFLEGSDATNLNGSEKVPLFESKIDLMVRTDIFLRWVQEREEKVIVVSSHATWLQSLCAFSFDLESAMMFKKGELRAVGIKFD